MDGVLFNLVVQEWGYPALVLAMGGGFYFVSNLSKTVKDHIQLDEDRFANLTEKLEEVRRLLARIDERTKRMNGEAH